MEVIYSRNLGGRKRALMLPVKAPEQPYYIVWGFHIHLMVGAPCKWICCRHVELPKFEVEKRRDRDKGVEGYVSRRTAGAKGGHLDGRCWILVLYTTSFSYFRRETHLDVILNGVVFEERYLFEDIKTACVIDFVVHRGRPLVCVRCV